MTTDDLRAALEAAITAERERVLRAIAQRYGRSRTSDLDRYADLLALRARWDATEYLASTMTDAGYMSTFASVRHEIESDVRRLLPVDGSTEAHSARKQDQPSG